LVLLSDTGTLKNRIRLGEGYEKGKARDVQARIEATGGRRTGISEGGLCRRVVLLHEDEGNGVSNIGILIANGHLGGEDRT